MLATDKHSSLLRTFLSLIVLYALGPGFCFFISKMFFSAEQFSSLGNEKLFAHGQIL